MADEEAVANGAGLVHLEATFDPQATEENEARDLQNGSGRQVMFRIEETMEELGDLKSENDVLQKRLLALQKRRSTIGTKLFLEGAETLYETRLQHWKYLKDEIDRVEIEYEQKIEDMQEQVREKQEEAKILRSEFLDFKWQMAREAEHSITRRPLKAKVIEKLQKEENDLDSEIEALRIQGKQLKFQLKKLEQAIWKKEELPGGLHLVDFEQLKIENESLSEKLSKKNAELVQIKKKSTHVVHVLTHVREKLQYVKMETEKDSKALQSVDTELLNKRKELHKVKSMCKNLRLKMAKMQADIVNLTNPALLDDYELNKENVEAFERKLRELKCRHAELCGKIKSLHTQIQQSVELGQYCLGNSISPEFQPANNLRWGAKRNVLKKKDSQ